jgi:hypothetical protein
MHLRSVIRGKITVTTLNNFLEQVPITNKDKGNVPEHTTLSCSVPIHCLSV